MSESPETTAARRRQQQDVSGLRLSPGVLCLDATSVVAIAKRKAAHVKHTVRSLNGVSVRTFATVHFNGREQLADIVTGSLYQDGRCLTGALEIVAEAVKPAKKPRAKWTKAQQACGFSNERMTEAA